MMKFAFMNKNDCYPLQVMLDFASINTMGNVTGRPSSAMLPHTSAINLSPTMSLNLHLGKTVVHSL